jgi:hypothetical protein
MKKSKRAQEHAKKMREYSKHLKDDFDWDYSYILRLLQYKLERTRKCIVSNNIVSSAPKIAQQITAVEDLLKRVIEDQYLDEIGAPFYAKFGRLKMSSRGTKKGEKFVPVTLKFEKETQRNSALLRRKHIALMLKAERMRRRDLSKAFKLMEKNIWGWWD